MRILSSAPLRGAVQRFAVLWGVALLHHQLGYGVAWDGASDIALTVSAVVLIVVPRLAVLTLAAVAHLLVVGDHLPSVYNHWWFAAWISVAALFAMLPAWQARRDGSDCASTAFHEGFAPAARLSLILLYLLAGFHKLNTDFLTPGISCGTVLTTQLGNTFGVPELGSQLGVVPAVLTLAAELGIPMLLLFSRTRAAGMIGALGFHVAMALAGYPRFSSTGLALLLLFLPAGTRLPWVERIWTSPTSRLVVVAVLMAVQWVAQDVADALLLFILLVLTAALAVAVWQVARRGEWSLPRGRISLAHVAPACVLVIGCLPYLGLATDRTWGMYSNLRVEGGTTNHLLVPVSSQLFTLQRDLVAVLDSDAPSLRSLARHDMLVPWVELRARVAEAAPHNGNAIELTYRRDGRHHHVPLVSNDSILSRPVSIWHRKLFRFRPVEASGPRACTV